MKTIQDMKRRLAGLLDDAYQYKNTKPPKKLIAEIQEIRQLIRYLETKPTEEMVFAQITEVRRKLDFIPSRYAGWFENLSKSEKQLPPLKLKAGFDECMRVLKPHGTLIFLPLNLLPTPMASYANHGGPNQRDSSGRPGLQMAAMAMLPTPTNSMVTIQDMVQANYHSTKRPEYSKICPAGTTSQLNPRFVAEMMGFPPDLTELPFRSGELNQSKPTATR